MNPLEEYYINQAGTGISGFTGLRYQRGNGWFGSLLSRVGVPVLKFLGKQFLNSGLNIASDALEGRNIKQSALGELQAAGKNTLGFVKNMVQSGSGRRRKCSKSIKTTKRRRKQSVVRKRSKKKYDF